MKTLTINSVQVKRLPKLHFSRGVETQISRLELYQEIRYIFKDAIINGERTYSNASSI